MTMHADVYFKCASTSTSVTASSFPLGAPAVSHSSTVASSYVPLVWPAFAATTASRLEVPTTGAASRPPLNSLSALSVNVDWSAFASGKRRSPIQIDDSPPPKETQPLAHGILIRSGVKVQTTTSKVNMAFTFLLDVFFVIATNT